MTTERFSVKDFEDALTQALAEKELTFENDGYRGSELRYHIPVKKSEHAEITIEIASSIGRDGFADSIGTNSIRIWVMGDGRPLAEKDQEYVTRVAGWQRRLTEVVDKAIVTAVAIPLCVKCGAPMKKRSGKRGEFWGCSRFPNCDKTMQILDAEGTTTTKQYVAEQKVLDAVPNCPTCGSVMVKRNGYKGAFWGCSKYPSCRGSRNIAEVVQPELPMVPAKVFKDSVYQSAIFSWADDNLKKRSGKSLVVLARAGSGKSTTGERLMQHIPAEFTALYMAFNVRVVNDMRKRALPKNLTVATTNSAGNGAVIKAFHPLFDNDKLNHIVEEVLDKYTYGHMYALVLQMVRLIKANLLTTSSDDFDWVADRYGIVMNGDREVIYAAVQAVYAKSVQMTNIIDYDDQIFLPVFCNLSCTQYDVVFLDETQDFTKAQTALAMKMVKPDGIIIAVGDDWQSMYGFRGADVDSMTNVRTLMDADSLPLSITYRNPVCVVEAVNRKFPEIGLEVAPWAKPGTITDMTPSRADVEYKPGDLVLCRCNAPLVKPAFSLIRRHIKAVILGRDIGSGLTTLVRKMRAGSIIDLIAKLTEYGNREVAKLLAADKNSAAETLHDRIETIVALSDGCTSVSEVEDNIEMVFSDKEEGVVFSSVHRAKGAEAERVFILSPELMPHPMAKQPWEREQERHIEYVAMTRTKETLVYVR